MIKNKNVSNNPENRNEKNLVMDLSSLCGLCFLYSSCSKDIKTKCKRGLERGCILLNSVKKDEPRILLPTLSVNRCMTGELLKEFIQ